jgi:hypothetical protein
MDAELPLFGELTQRTERFASHGPGGCAPDLGAALAIQTLKRPLFLTATAALGKVIGRLGVYSVEKLSCFRRLPIQI